MAPAEGKLAGSNGKRSMQNMGVANDHKQHRASASGSQFERDPQGAGAGAKAHPAGKKAPAKKAPAAKKAAPAKAASTKLRWTHEGGERGKHTAQHAVTA